MQTYPLEIILKFKSGQQEVNVKFVVQKKVLKNPQAPSLKRRVMKALSSSDWPAV